MLFMVSYVVFKEEHIIIYGSFDIFARKKNQKTYLYEGIIYWWNRYNQYRCCSIGTAKRLGDNFT